MGVEVRVEYNPRCVIRGWKACAVSAPSGTQQEAMRPDQVLPRDSAPVTETGTSRVPELRRPQRLA